MSLRQPATGKKVALLQNRREVADEKSRAGPVVLDPGSAGRRQRPRWGPGGDPRVRPQGPARRRCARPRAHRAAEPGVPEKRGSGPLALARVRSERTGCGWASRPTGTSGTTRPAGATRTFRRCGSRRPGWTSRTSRPTGAPGTFRRWRDDGRRQRWHCRRVYHRLRLRWLSAGFAPGGVPAGWPPGRPAGPPGQLRGERTLSRLRVHGLHRTGLARRPGAQQHPTAEHYQLDVDCISTDRGHEWQRI